MVKQEMRDERVRELSRGFADRAVRHVTLCKITASLRRKLSLTRIPFAFCRPISQSRRMGYRQCLRC